MTGIPRPPLLGSLPAGTRLVAGLGYATVLADMDFETYSEAGFVWDAAENKWTCLPNAPQRKKGLSVVGAARYAEHPTAEVLTLSYDLKDGRGKRRWRPGMLPPVDLFAHIRAGGLIEAWNSGFEHHIWHEVCMPKYGWPDLPQAQLRCAMAKSRAYSLPGALGKAADVLGLAAQKNKDGRRLLEKFSIPRNPTKKDGRLRITPAEDPADAEALYAYCDEDIAAEAEASSVVPDLIPEELANWLTDQRINYRGVAADVVGIENCVAIIDQAHDQYNRELRALTGGTVQRASELQKLIGWLGAQGVHTASLDEEHLDELLSAKEDGADCIWHPESDSVFWGDWREVMATPSADAQCCVLISDPLRPPPGVVVPRRRVGLPLLARRALEIRATIGSAAVKKAYAMRNRVCADGRLRDLFNYYAARTGRTTGEGPQPTNMPNSGPELMACEGCHGYYAPAHQRCPHCGAHATLAHKEEWSPEAAEFALSIIAARSLPLVEYYFVDAMAVVSGCLRGLFIAGPGKDLICSDYSAIEAVVLAFLAGVEWRKEVFRTHGKIYEASAAQAFKVPVEEILRHKKETGNHHPLRKKGKVLELACFGSETQVLTNRGYVRIVDVAVTDTLWDGEEWVRHQGLVGQGIRQVIDLDGVEATPNQLVSLRHSWKEAKELASNGSFLSQALETGSENLPSRVFGKAARTQRYLSSAPVGQGRTESRLQTSAPESHPGAPRALSKRRQPLGSKQKATKTTGFTRRSWRTLSIAGGFSIACLRRSVGAIARAIVRMKTMAVGVSRSATYGAKTNPLSSSTSSPFLGGMTLPWKWIEKTTTGGTGRGTSGSSARERTTTTAAPSGSFNGGSTSLRHVFDIAHAGPRNRFTIKTASGHLIVHNCGYGGWVGSWRAFGGEGTDDEISNNIVAWRDASPEIVEMWGGQERRKPWRKELFGIEGMFIAATLNPGTWYETHGLGFFSRNGTTYVRLLSGRLLTYHRVRLRPSERRAGTLAISFEGQNTNPKNGPVGWIRMDTYGPRLTENVVQATARDIQWFGMRNLEAAGYGIVLHVYDEDVAEVPEGWGSVEEFERIMSTMPHWAAGWPVKANGGWRGKRYRK